METETREPLRAADCSGVGNDDQLPSTSDVTTSGLTVSGIECGPASGSGDLAPRSQRTSRVSVQIKEPPVSEMRDYVPQDGEGEDGEDEEKKKKRRSVLHRAIPVMPLSLAVTCCLLNIVLPGFGTLLAGFSVFCCATTQLSKPVHACALNVASGLLQVATFIVILGWIWSIIWGMTFVHLSLSAKRTKQLPLVPYYVRRHSSVDF